MYVLVGSLSSKKKNSPRTHLRFFFFFSSSFFLAFILNEYEVMKLEGSYSCLFSLLACGILLYSWKKFFLAKSKTKEGLLIPVLPMRLLLIPLFASSVPVPPTDLLRDSVVYVNKRDPLR
jgi:hypothetical protein